MALLVVPNALGSSTSEATGSRVTAKFARQVAPVPAATGKSSMARRPSLKASG